MRDSIIRWTLGIGAIALCAAFFFQTNSQAAGDGASAVASSPTYLTQFKFKFDGANSCASEKCHGAAKATMKEDYWGNEYTLWHGAKDPHHKAYRTLITAPAKAIATKLKIESALKSERCLNCHATYATGPGGVDLKGKEYSAVEGVSCGSCHGPSEKWLDPHSKEGWVKQQRAKSNTEQLLQTVGILDTKPVPQRAQRCTSCHLAIEADLVAAGHPQPTFEMNYFSSLYLDKYDRHWHDPAGMFPATLWASGQVVEVHDAMMQVAQHAGSSTPDAADQMAKSYAQAMAHYQVFSALFSTGAVSGDASKLDGDVKKLTDAVAARDKAAATTAATAASADVRALEDAVVKFAPSAASLQKLLTTVAAADTGKTYGPRGEEQQAYAILAFAQASGNQPLATAVQPLLPTKPGEAPKPDDFAKALNDVRGKLPK